MIIEEWRDIPGYENLYQVSDLGRVRRIHNGQWKIKKPGISKRGYMSMTLSKNGTPGYFHLNQLVAMAFIPNPENKPVVNHIDGVPMHNFVENLEWATYSENIRHAYDNDLAPSGENHPLAKLNNEQVNYIRNHYIPYDAEFGQTALARKFNVNSHIINLVVRGKTYKNASGKITERSYRRKFTNRQVLEIRSLYAAGGISIRKLARRFNVGNSAIRDIIKENTYRDVK